MQRSGVYHLIPVSYLMVVLGAGCWLLGSIGEKKTDLAPKKTSQTRLNIRDDSIVLVDAQEQMKDEAGRSSVTHPLGPTRSREEEASALPTTATALDWIGFGRWGEGTAKGK
jgi:hypothetical protein